MTYERPIKAQHAAHLSSELDTAFNHPAALEALREMLNLGFRDTAEFQSGWIGAHPIAVNGGFFSLAEEGPPACVIPALAGSSDPFEKRELVDLIAWHIDSPERWYLRSGVAVALGEHHGSYGWLNTDPVRFFRTPHSWLINRASGACLLDETQGYALFGQIAQVVAEDLSHGEELAALLAPPKLPKPQILIPEDTPA